MEKTKEKGIVKRTTKIIANGVQCLNGKQCTKHYKVPIIVLDFVSPESSHEYARGERFAFWFKLEDAQYKKVVDQLKPDLREFTMWLDGENQEKLRSFMLDIPQNMKQNTLI